MPPPEIDIPAAVQHPLAAGLAGALIGLRWAPGDCWLQRLANVAALGAIAPGNAAYLRYKKVTSQR